MSELPDDIRAFEAQLGQLVPAHRLNVDHLNYEAGYAAGLAARKQSSRTIRSISIIGSAAVGAALLYGSLALIDTRSVRTPNVDVQAMAATPGNTDGGERDRAQRTSPPLSTVKMHRDLILGDGSLSIESDHGVRSLRPDAEPLRIPVRTMLQWRNELFDDGLYFGETT